MLLHNRPCGFYHQFVFYLTAVHQSEEDVGARNDDLHLSGFSSGRTKKGRSLRKKTLGAASLSGWPLQTLTTGWERLKKDACTQDKDFRTQGLSEPLAVGCNKCTTRMTLPVILSVLLVWATMKDKHFHLANKWLESKGKLRGWKEDMQLKPQYQKDKGRLANPFFQPNTVWRRDI